MIFLTGALLMVAACIIGTTLQTHKIGQVMFNFGFGMILFSIAKFIFIHLP